MLTPEEISAASAFLKGKVRHTPLERSPLLSEMLGVPVFCKLENLQITGSFKVRGALYRLSKLSAMERGRGVITASAGNHGKGVAYAAKEFGTRAIVYVPRNVDGAKLEGMLALGAEVERTACAGFDETAELAAAAAAKSGRPFISAFAGSEIVAANGGSLAEEIFADLPEAGSILFPLGGGGMGAGIASWCARPGGRMPRLIACQHAGSPAYKLSLERGTAVTNLPPIETMAGGIEGGIGKENFALLRPLVREVALATEAEILAASRWCLEKLQYLVEPTAAVTIAAALSGKLRFEAKAGPVVIVLSGRNVSVENLREILGRVPRP